ncbi:hypothetical protein [Methyloversatilis sp.]|uniref:hypothetical protein n=1 Tax=Methyloversatilis sp. TaxID=2569862 RepID=UPI003D278126
MQREAVGEYEIRSRVQQLVDAQCEGEVINVSLPYWHEPDETGCNWNISNVSAPSGLAAAVRACINEVRKTHLLQSDWLILENGNKAHVLWEVTEMDGAWWPHILIVEHLEDMVLVHDLQYRDLGPSSTPEAARKLARRIDVKDITKSREILFEIREGDD